MIERSNSDDSIFQFLAGTFHQDAGTPDEAVQELLSSESVEYLRDIVEVLQQFILLDTPECEKNEYIQHCADGVYFPELKRTPLEWLKEIVETITQSFTTK